jgi:hypothetical protein
MELTLHRGRVARAAVVGAAAVLALAAAGPASAKTKRHAPLAHGHFVQLNGTRANANQSNNWFGYNQGTLEQGGKQFTSISGDWTVPTATQHTSGQDESSSDWIGIGGGCIDATCTLTDNTLIQTGTEQDVSSGKASYSSWWEIIPGPSIDTGLKISAGDHMHADITEAVAGSNVWNITLKDVTSGQTFTQTVPYPSTHATAEWIEETPLIIGTNAGLASLPNLSHIDFTSAKTNGAPANLNASEEMLLTDSNGGVIGTPSAPNASADGFGLCAWATSCSY